MLHERAKKLDRKVTKAVMNYTEVNGIWATGNGVD